MGTLIESCEFFGLLGMSHPGTGDPGLSAAISRDNVGNEEAKDRPVPGLRPARDSRRRLWTRVRRAAAIKRTTITDKAKRRRSTVITGSQSQSQHIDSVGSAVGLSCWASDSGASTASSLQLWVVSGSGAPSRMLPNFRLGAAANALVPQRGETGGKTVIMQYNATRPQRLSTLPLQTLWPAGTCNGSAALMSCSAKSMASTLSY